MHCSVNEDKVKKQREDAYSTGEVDFHGQDTDVLGTRHLSVNGSNGDSHGIG